MATQAKSSTAHADINEYFLEKLTKHLENVAQCRAAGSPPVAKMATDSLRRFVREARGGRSSHARARILPKKLSCSQARREQGAEEARALRARDPAPSAVARRARQDPVPNFHVDTAHTGALAQAWPLILTRRSLRAIGPTQKTQSAL